MNEPSEKNELLAALEQERGIRRASKLLASQQTHIYEELDRLVSYLKLLLPQSHGMVSQAKTSNDLIIEAARRLEDPLVVELITQTIKKRENSSFQE